MAGRSSGSHSRCIPNSGRSTNPLLALRTSGEGDWPAQPDDQEVPMQKVLHEIRAREKHCAGSALEMPQGMQVRG